MYVKIVLPREGHPAKEGLRHNVCIGEIIFLSPREGHPAKEGLRPSCTLHTIPRVVDPREGHPAKEGLRPVSITTCKSNAKPRVGHPLKEGLRHG